jgi:hypothetical protein
MTIGTKCNQVPLVIIALMAAEPLVVDLKISLRPAVLTAPVITLHHIPAESAVGFWIEP